MICTGVGAWECVRGCVVWVRASAGSRPRSSAAPWRPEGIGFEGIEVFAAVTAVTTATAATAAATTTKQRKHANKQQ